MRWTAIGRCSDLAGGEGVLHQSRRAGELLAVDRSKFLALAELPPVKKSISFETALRDRRASARQLYRVAADYAASRR